MYKITVDFEVWKTLTSKRLVEGHTYNDVIRELLGLDSVVEGPDQIELLYGDFASNSVTEAALGFGNLENSTAGFPARGIFLPNGTVIKATYKQQQYIAEIVDGKWLDTEGKSHSSPSSAAKHVTGTSVNGLRFWSVKRPSDASWHRLDLLK
jgi:hypothetical protein